MQIGERIDGFQADTPLLGSVAEFDSMTVVTVLMMLEERYGFAIEDDEISADVFATVGALASFVEKKVAA